MPHEESSDFCPACNRRVLVRRDTANHLLHLIVTLLVCGFWLPIWIICALSPGRWRCTICGGEITWASKAWAAVQASPPPPVRLPAPSTLAPVSAPVVIVQPVAPAPPPGQTGPRIAVMGALSVVAVAIAVGAWEPTRPALPSPPAATTGRTWTTRPRDAAPRPTAHLRDAPPRGDQPATYVVFVREDHGPGPDGERARAIAAGSAVVVLEERGGQARISVRGWEGWVEASAVERGQ